MVFDNIKNFLNRNNYGPKHIKLADFMKKIVQRQAKKTQINDYAIYTMVHLKNRRHLYLQERNVFKKALNSISKELTLSINDYAVSISTPILSNMDQMSIIQYTLDNVLFTIIFFLCLLSFILIYSLMQSVSS